MTHCTLILRQTAAVLEGDGQRNVVDAVDRNRNLDLFGLAGDIVRGERRTVLIIQGCSTVAYQRGIAAGTIHGCIHAVLDTCARSAAGPETVTFLVAVVGLPAR